ncbi:hypothetical protein HY418_01945 [Candidatus Kaiserbacteria bacterium]|nr:hypothetical protein [Candidatus Kaiserbacteria bacterium]
MKSIPQYLIVGVMVIVAMLGIPLIFPSKGNPYNGKSVGQKSSLEMKG